MMNDQLFTEYLKARGTLEARIAETIDRGLSRIDDRDTRNMLFDIRDLMATMANVENQMIKHINKANEANAE